eukprot:SAG31_NODE_211_length_20274_cov_40.333482_4_plen_37_part_00
MVAMAVTAVRKFHVRVQLYRVTNANGNAIVCVIVFF